MKTKMRALAVFALLGCGGGAAAGQSEPEPMRGTHGGGMHGQMMQGAETACPMMLEGAEVSVEDIERGVAMTFTTDRSEAVAELRERVRDMAAMHERHTGMMRGGMMGEEGGGMGAMPGATASVLDVPNGARLELVASDAADVGSLRRHASMHAEHMRGREGCPMMGAPAA